MLRDEGFSKNIFPTNFQLETCIKNRDIFIWVFFFFFFPVSSFQQWAIMSFCLQSICPVRTRFREKFISAVMPSHPANRLGKSGARRGGAGGRDAWQNIDFTRGPQAPGSVQVGGLLFYFISLESSANLPSLSLFLWGPRELLSFDKGKGSQPPPGCLCQGPCLSGRGAGAVRLGRGCAWGVADLWLCRPRGGSTQHERGHWEIEAPVRGSACV